MTTVSSFTLYFCLSNSVYHLNSITWATRWSFTQFCTGETWESPSSFRIPSITGVEVTFCCSRYAQYGAQLMPWYSSTFTQHCLLTGSALSGWKLTMLYKLLPLLSTQDELSASCSSTEKKSKINERASSILLITVLLYAHADCVWVPMCMYMPSY